MEEKLLFPENFWWGSAWSAEQAEGHSGIKKAKTVWDKWFEEDPEKFFDNIGPEIASDHINRYIEDVELMKKTGHNSFRLSISWARMFPDGGKGVPNQQAINFYRKLFLEMNSKGIKIFVNLYHFDMPLDLQEIGGWEFREVVEHFVNFANCCFDNFGDLVFRWFTFNEPLGPILGNYIEGFHYPKIMDFKRGVQATFFIILAHAKIIKIFKTKNLNSKIGVILNLSPTYARSENPEDKEAAEIADLFYTRSFLDPMVKGVFPEKLIEILKKYNQMPLDYIKSDLQTIEQNTAQLLGLNYYEPRRVKARTCINDKQEKFSPELFFEKFDMPGIRLNKYRGWEIYPEGIYDLCMDIKNNYSNIEAFISENGMGVANEDRFINQYGQVEDFYRIDFIKEHLAYTWKAIQTGCNIKGYHVWTFIDCWSWINAYKNRYGLIALDLKTNNRTIKKSGEFYKLMSDTNGFMYDKSSINCQ